LGCTSLNYFIYKTTIVAFMNRILLLLILIGMGQASFAQYVYTIKADSVKITNSCDTAELIIENHTQTVPGFLYNKGRGRTEFRRGAVKISDSVYVVGGDTINVMAPGTAWLINGNSNINEGVNFLGTTNGASLVMKTNNTERARVTGNTGNLLVGSASDNGAKLQVYGKETIYGNEDATQLAIRLPASPAITTPVIQVQQNDGTSLLDMRVDSTSIYMGAGAGANNQSAANYNIAIGKAALAANTTGKYNFAIGMQTLTNNTTGNYNIAIGNGIYGGANGGPAMYNNTTGSLNVALGINALFKNTTGSNNVAIGQDPLARNVDGTLNVGIGTGALKWGPTGSYNVAIGAGALGSSLTNTPSNQNVAVGCYCAQQQQIGINNVFMGYRTNFSTSAGDNNIVIGATSYISGTSNTIVLGQGITNVTQSNVVVLGRTDQNILLGSSGFADNGARLQVTGSQTTSANLGVGGITSMTAKVHIAASDGSTGTAPVKLTAGPVLTTPENGAIEFDGTDLYLTENTSRYKLAKTLGGQITTNFGGISLGAFNAITATLTVAGAQPGDVVNVSANSGASNSPSLIITAFVTSTNSVILQAYNASNSAVTIVTDTYKVRVIK
jgi:hypothetical protein